MRVETNQMSAVVALERHFAVKEIAELWGLDESTVRKLFQEEPGVLKLGESHRAGKRGYVSIRIPESVAVRVHERRSR